MFSSLKRKLFIIYMLSIFSILIFSTSFIYISTKNDITNSIEMRLDMSKKEDQAPRYGNGEDMESEPLGNGDESLNDELLPFDSNFKNEFVVNDQAAFEQFVDENIAAGSIIDKENKRITSGDQTYLYNYFDGTYKIIEITYDIQNLQSLFKNLCLVVFLATGLFAIVGYVLISKLIKPIRVSYERQHQFVSDASHEMKTPLAVSKSCLSLIEVENEDNKTMLEYLKTENDRLIRLTDNLLQLSARNTIHHELVDASKRIELVLSGLEVRMFENDITFTSNVEPNITAKLNGDDIAQLVTIFIDNAIKYNDKRKRINFRLTRDRKYLYISVANTSEVITDEQMEKLFDRFYRVEKSRNNKGFGLGLSLAKHICEINNGKISNEYTNGQFYITAKLPID